MKNFYLSIVFLLTPVCALKGQNEFIVQKLPATVNTAYDEITPVIARDGKTLFFTRAAYPEFNRTLILDTTDYAIKLSPDKYLTMLGGIYRELGDAAHQKDPARSPFNQDVWMAEGDSFQQVSHPGFPLNNALPNSLVALTPDPNTFYVINQFKKTGDMNKGFSYVRKLPDSLGWSFPAPVEIKDFYTITSDVSLTMSFDGKALILAAARYDSRDMDLYICFREGENKWSKPLLLEGINSDKREVTPFLSEDNKTLFFASNRWSSSGGMDIYLAKRLDDTWQNWSAPMRLGEPINSNKDESQPYFNMTTGCLYFASRREGSSDIYKVQIAPPQPTELTIKGRIINRQTRQLAEKARVRYWAEGGVSNVFTSEDGTFSLKIPKGVAFDLCPEKAGFTGKTERAFFRRDYYYFKDYFSIDLWLDPMEIGAVIELKPVFFSQSKALILEQSFSEMERLTQIMEENVGLKIRIEGHTDNIGKEEDLQQLSEARAQAVKNFLVERGIAAERISVVGFGARRPINDNATEELRQMNRRVEVKISGI